MSISTTIGDDVYGFLNLLSKRQGPNDSTVPLPFAGGPQPEPKPPQPPVLPQLPFAVPEPTSRKRVQLAQGGPATMNDASLSGGGGTDTLAGGGGTDALKPPPPAKPSVPAPAMPTDPALAAAITQASQGTGIGNFDIAGYLEKQRKAQAINDLINGAVASGMLVPAALTGDPGVRSMLAAGAGRYMDGDGAGGGTDATGAKGGLGLMKTLMELREKEAEGKTKLSTLRGMPSIARQLDIPVNQLVAIYQQDPKKYAELVSAMSQPEMHVEKLGDGRLQIFNKNRPNDPPKIIGQTDEFAVAKRAEEAAQAPLTRAQTAATTAKTTLDIDKLKADLDADRLTEAQRDQLQTELGLTPAQAKTMDAATLRTYTKERLSYTEQMKNFEAANAQRLAAGMPLYSTMDEWKHDMDEKTALKKDFDDENKLIEAENKRLKGLGLKPITPLRTLKDLEDRRSLAEQQKAAATGRDAASGQAALKVSETALTQNDTKKATVGDSLAMDRELASGKVRTGSDLMPLWHKFNKAFEGLGLEPPSEKTTATEIYSRLATIKQVREAREGKGDISNYENLLQERISGSALDQPAEAARHGLASDRWAVRQQLARNNERIEQGGQILRSPDGKPLFKGTTLNEIDDGMTRYLPNEEVTQMLKDPAYRDGNFALVRGSDAADYIEQNMEKVIQSKMQTGGTYTDPKTGRVTQTPVYNQFDKTEFDSVKELSVEFLERPEVRAAAEANYRNKYGPLGVGLYDMILEAKRQKKFGAS